MSYSEKQEVAANYSDNIGTNSTLTTPNTEQNTELRHEIEDGKINIVQNQKTTEGNDDETEYILYGYRNFNLALYCFGAMMNQMTWISLQPVIGAIENGYGYGATAISALGITYMIVFLIVNYPSSVIIDKLGLRYACLIGVGFTTLGMIVKCLVN